MNPIPVVWKPMAVNALENIYQYIDLEKKAPQTAKKYISAMIDFADSLGYSNLVFSQSQYKGFDKFKSVHFRKTYIFFFKQTTKRLTICHIIHGKALKM